MIGSKSSRQGLHGQLTIAAAILLATGACNPSSPRRPLEGRVLLNGSPLKQGSIRLLPSPECSGPAASTSITDGRYAFTTDTGPHPGLHRVVIQTNQPRAGGSGTSDNSTITKDIKSIKPAADDLPLESASPAAAPPRSSWELECTVPTEGNFRRDFELDL